LNSILTDNGYFSFVCGILIFVTGIIIFINFLPEDFLKPGFVKDGIIIQDEQIFPGQSINGIMTITDVKKDTVIAISNPLSEILFRAEVKNPEGLTVYDSDRVTVASNTFKPGMVGKYNVLITNLGSKTTEITVNYGHHIYEENGDNPKSILDISAVCLIIVGAYLIIHTDFKFLSNTKKNII